MRQYNYDTGCIQKNTKSLITKSPSISDFTKHDESAHRQRQDLSESRLRPPTPIKKSEALKKTLQTIETKTVSAWNTNSKTIGAKVGVAKNKSGVTTLKDTN